jgi:putative Holliday junction resolvase
MAIIALDFGKRRIGIAISDPSGSGAYPIAVVKRRSLTRDLEEIERIFATRGVTRVVVGLPLNMDGSEGPAARAAREFARRVGDHLGLPVELQDERLSSVEARERIGALSRGKRKKPALDAIAAAVILEGWLEAARRIR